MAGGRGGAMMNAVMMTGAGVGGAGSGDDQRGQSNSAPADAATDSSVATRHSRSPQPNCQAA
jgi:hypothetical protein